MESEKEESTQNLPKMDGGWWQNGSPTNANPNIQWSTRPQEPKL